MIIESYDKGDINLRGFNILKENDLRKISPGNENRPETLKISVAKRYFAVVCFIRIIQ
ncbi:MAG: hypothetical protein AB1480_12125 [Nitrospirota bacterium]